MPAGAESGAMAVSLGFVMFKVAKGDTPETLNDAGVPGTRIAISAKAAFVLAVVADVAGFSVSLNRKA